MTAKIIPIGCITRLDLNPDDILERAKGQLEGVVIIGFEKDDGALYAASSYADGGTVMWLLEACKKALMEATP
jgi:hypothetical protein